MAFVRTRKTLNGPDGLYGETISTTLLESYRENGRVRQRILANLHGEPDTLSALAKLAAMRADLREEKKALAPESETIARLNQLSETVAQNALFGHQYSAADRQEIDYALKVRKRLLKIDAMLAVIERDGSVIRKHCSAPPEEVQAAIRKYKKRTDEAEALSLAAEFTIKQHVKEAKAMRRLSLRSRKT
jgi:hypothetical protein